MSRSSRPPPSLNDRRTPTPAGPMFPVWSRVRYPPRDDAGPAGPGYVCAHGGRLVGAKWVGTSNYIGEWIGGEWVDLTLLFFPVTDGRNVDGSLCPACARGARDTGERRYPPICDPCGRLYLGAVYYGTNRGARTRRAGGRS